MSDALIGPNAILQMMPVLERRAGAARAASLLREAGAMMPDGSEMIPEGEAARLHQLVRANQQAQAPLIAAEAGQHTAQYILANRIPRAAQALLRALPARLAAPILARAITQHAWTFAGSGQFRALSPWRFEIADNPLVRGEQSQTCLCTWHAAVFSTLYRRLVHPGVTCVETQCAAQPDVACCAFTLTRS